MERSKLEQFRRQLTDELATVDSQLADHGATGDEVEIGLDEGFADSAQASTERSELVGAVRQLNSHRDELLAALDRIEVGTYGICEGCGRAIDADRLDALPAVRLCLACKAART
jgi:RNA polymerase-binding transcription factor DksA